MEKLCKCCGETKPTSEFHKDKSKSDGLNAYCKPCTIKRQQAFSCRPPRFKAPDGHKKCNHCKVILPLENFTLLASSFDGHAKTCKACMFIANDKWRRKNLAKCALRQRANRKNSRERYKDYSRKSRYGLPPGEFDALLLRQNNRCAICQTDKPGNRAGSVFSVDHNHVTKAVRGLLCGNCNFVIGHAKDSVEILQSAIEYLKKEGGI